ncbi:MAG: hypothetical protein SFT92_09920 [Rickettsiales bacterium]|nr:hypothetical protein [Rickettsiales bacterium]
MNYVQLPERVLMQVSGDDRFDFLQGLVSNDVQRVKQGEAVYAALLTPQGKFLHDFILYPQADAIWLDTHQARADDLRKRLQLYKLRSKVAIEALPESMGVVAAWGGEAAVGFADPRDACLGVRLPGDVAANLHLAEKNGWLQQSAGEYDYLRLRCGVADSSRDLTADKSLLLESRFEEMQGVSFTKGCYVGQEVTARSKHRGQVRKSLAVVQLQQGHFPDIGTPIMVGDKIVGEMKSHCRDLGMALLRLDEIEALNASQLHIGDAIVTRFFIQEAV